MYIVRARLVRQPFYYAFGGGFVDFIYPSGRIPSAVARAGRQIHHASILKARHKKSLKSKLFTFSRTKVKERANKRDLMSLLM